MTKQEIYERIVQLTSELHATNVAEKIFSAAKEGDPEKVEEVFETSKEENPDLYQKILKFEEDFDSDYHVTVNIFGSKEDKTNGVHYGLGLAICRELCEKLDGKISFYKRNRDGIVFEAGSERALFFQP